MADKEIQFRKKREIGDIFSDSFAFLRQEKRQVTKLVVIYVLPFIILYAFVHGYLQKNVISKIDFANPEALLANLGPFYTNVLFFALFGLFVQCLLISTYYTFLEEYIKRGNSNFELSEVSSRFFSNGLLAIGAGLIIFILSLFGFMMCFLPGIYFANTLSLAFVILVFEKRGIPHALKRSALMVNTQWWGTFLINLTGIVIVWAAGFIITFPLSLMGLTKNILDTENTSVALPEWYWIVVGISTVVSSALYVFLYTFMAFQYFNINERIKDLLPPAGN
jgi:hypothetical protein